MVKNYKNHANKCHKSKIHGVVKHQLPNLLHHTIISLPFEYWETNIIRSIDPPSSTKYYFILVGIE